MATAPASYDLPPHEIKDKMVEEYLKMHFTNEKTKISSDAIKMVVELLRIYICEVGYRCSEQADILNEEVINVQHLEKILPQFLLDFN